VEDVTYGRSPGQRNSASRSRWARVLDQHQAVCFRQKAEMQIGSETVCSSAKIRSGQRALDDALSVFPAVARISRRLLLARLDRGVYASRRLRGSARGELLVD
jgi:hypothetical protein